MIKKQLIMEKAFELFAKNGIEATSVQQITEVCGISKGAFYLSYKSKDELVFALINYYLSELAGNIEQAVSKNTQDETLLYHFYFQIFNAYQSHSNFAKVLIKEQFTKIKVIILTTFNDKEYIQDALSYGAFGYMLKDSSHEVIYEGIKTAYMGNMVVHPEVANKILYKSNDGHRFKELKKYNFSEKELQIIKYIAEGLSNKEISDKVYLSEGTIKNNITNILSKLNLRDRTQIAIFAFKNGIVT